MGITLLLFFKLFIIINIMSMKMSITMYFSLLLAEGNLKIIKNNCVKCKIESKSVMSKHKFFLSGISISTKYTYYVNLTIT